MCVRKPGLGALHTDYPETYPLDTNALQGCHSTGGWLVATAAQAQLSIPIVTPDIDLGKDERRSGSVLLLRSTPCSDDSKEAKKLFKQRMK